MGLPDIHSLWAGRPLGPLEQICLASFAARGHRVFLHSYEKYDLPDGVEWISAETLCPKNKIIVCRRNNSLALFGDYYRLLILQNFDAVWADADIYCLRAYDFDSDYIIPAAISGDSISYASPAVLRAPRNSELLKEMLGVFEDYRRALPFFSLRQRIKFRLAALLNREFSLQDMPWGSGGPLALTHVTRKLNLTGQAIPQHKVYAIQGPRLFDPDFDFRSRLGPDSYSVHFLHSQVPHGAPENPRTGSFYAWGVEQVGHMTPYFRSQGGKASSRAAGL